MSSFPMLIEAYIQKKLEGKKQKKLHEKKRKEQINGSQEKIEENKVELYAAAWLESASQRASQISIATHVLKYTHSDAKGSNVYVKRASNQNEGSRRYVSTDTLSKITEDVVGNAAAMDIAGLLNIEVNGVTFLDLIANNDSSALAPFADNEVRLSSWMEGFKGILSDRSLCSHTLAKQVFFPIDESNYHLLAPLYASSLAHALHDRITDDRYSEKAKEARDRKRKADYSEQVLVDYPDLAFQRFGGTKPQNISRLNSLRGGKSYLLRSAPPVWRCLDKPPLKKSEFWRSYGRKTTHLIKEFRIYLKAIKNRDSTKDIRNDIQDFVDRLIDDLLLAAAEVQAMQAGWSSVSELPLHEQLWLDPNRKDLQVLRSIEPWKEGISNHFATWVIQKIEDTDLRFNEVNHAQLSRDCLKILKRVE